MYVCVYACEGYAHTFLCKSNNTKRKRAATNRINPPHTSSTHSITLSCLLCLRTCVRVCLCVIKYMRLLVCVCVLEKFNNNNHNNKHMQSIEMRGSILKAQ